MKRHFINLPKLISRRQPGAHRMGYAAYKTDGKSPELEALEKLNEATETKYKEIREQLDLKTKEIGELTTATKEYDAKVKEYESAVKELNTILGDKGCTLKQIQDEVKELQTKSGRIATPKNVPQTAFGIQQMLMKEFEENIEKVKAYRDDVHNQNNPLPIFQTKAAGTMTAGNNMTGVSIDTFPTFSTDFAVRGRMRVHARDLIRTINTATGSYIFPRQNIPAGDGSVAVTTSQGATKSKRDYDNTLVQVLARYRAGTVDIANEMVQDIPGITQYITEELTEDYLRTETFDFMAALIAAATGSTGLPAGVTVPAERIPHYVANLEQQDYQPDTLIVRPRQWATLLNTKPQDYSTPGGFLVLPSGDILFAGLRLVKMTTNAMTDSEIVIGDFRKALIVQKSGEGFRVQMFNQHDQAVYANLTTFRGECRAELAILRPDAFLRGSL